MLCWSIDFREIETVSSVRDAITFEDVTETLSLRHGVRCASESGAMIEDALLTLGEHE